MAQRDFFVRFLLPMPQIYVPARKLHRDKTARRVSRSRWATYVLTGAFAATALISTDLAHAQGGSAKTNAATAPQAAQAANVTAADLEAVRAIVGGVYGWRDGRQVPPPEKPPFSPRIDALIAQCKAAVARADPRANNGEGAYAVLGDQGCEGEPLLKDIMSGEPAPFIPRARPTVRSIGPDTIEAEFAVPAPYRAEWGSGQIIRFQRIGGRWLIDEIETRRSDGTARYSAELQGKVAALRAIAKTSRSR